MPGLSDRTRDTELLFGSFKEQDAVFDIKRKVLWFEMGAKRARNMGF